MRPNAIDDPVAHCVCKSVCLLCLQSAITAKQVDVLVELKILEGTLDWGPNPPTGRRKK